MERSEGKDVGGGIKEREKEGKGGERERLKVTAEKEYWKKRKDNEMKRRDEMKSRRIWKHKREENENRID